MQQRLESLDWLRGLMALSIMVYHFFGGNDGGTALGKLGIYGVSIFFILSGLSMAIAYDLYIRDATSAVSFFVRRLFRIWPLLWLAVFLVAVPASFSGKPIDMTTILLNLTTLFGFVSPTQYINTGAWSIGNEMVYYALTPALIAAYHWSTTAGNTVTLLATVVAAYFAFVVLDPATPLATQWHSYVNPFNNLFLYCAGLALYYNFRRVEVPRRLHLILLILIVAIFFLYPASGDLIGLVTGANRIFMSACSIAVVFVFYKCAPELPKVVGSGFEQLGIATYGVYLLHPIVMAIIVRGLGKLGIEVPYMKEVLAIAITIPLALLTFKLIEAPFVKLGKRLTKRKDGAGAATVSTSAT